MLPVEPMLLSRARAWPAGGDWVLEPKWDGFRVLAAIDRARVRAWTRHGTEISVPLAAVLDELGDLVPSGSLLDGELVALATGPDGRIGQDFSRLAPAVFAGRPYPPARGLAGDPPVALGRRSARAAPSLSALA